MPLLEFVPTLPAAGTLAGTEKIGVIGADGLPVQTTAQAIANLFAVADGSITAPMLAAALAAKLWTLDITVGDETLDKIILTIQVKDVNGTNVAAATQLAFKPCSTLDGLGNYAVSDEGAGVGLTTSSEKVSAIVTNASGVAEIGITYAAAGAVKLAFETPLGPVVQSLTFA